VTRTLIEYELDYFCDDGAHILGMVWMIDETGALIDDHLNEDERARYCAETR
jgi:hypothetical protein